jgi:putative ABC transport system permease protein
LGTVSAVTPDYFRTMKIPLLAGRYFTELDTIGAPGVVIIDDLLAQRYFAGENPIGRRISIGGGRQWREIVGIVGHVKHDGLDEGKGDLQYYYSTYQGDQQTGQRVVIRSRTDPLTLVSPIQDAIQKIDKDQPIFRVTSMMQNVRATTAQRRFLVLLLSIFAGTALALAAIGLYGVIAYSVSRRTHEIGIRMALGAQAADVLRLIIGQGLRLVLIGVALGLVGALALTRMLADLLFDVSPKDPITFAAIPLLLVGVALLASYLPARRATKVDPMVALRHE